MIKLVRLGQDIRWDDRVAEFDQWPPVNIRVATQSTHDHPSIADDSVASGASARDGRARPAVPGSHSR